MGIDTNNGVGVILVDRQGRFLLQLRDELEDIAWPGMWGIVGGAIELGESPHEAAVRETEEEVGQRIEEIHLVGAIPAVWSGGGTLHVFCAGAAFLDADIVVGEGQDARFFDPGDIRQLERTTPYLKPMVSGFVSDPRYEQCMRDARETS
jgi:8-oxo-dGTP pyrophosphatase MutT (NUDIX family)